MFNIFITILLFLLLYGLTEYIHRRYKVNTYYTRKLAHVLSGIGAIGFSYVLNKIEFSIATLFFIFFFILMYKRKLLKSIHMHDTIGEILYPISLLILALSFYEKHSVFIAGVLILAISDTVSAFVGKKNSIKPQLFHSYIGHATSTFVILIFYTNPLTAIFMSVLLAIVEYFSYKGWDNFTVPIAYVILVILFNL